MSDSSPIESNVNLTPLADVGSFVSYLSKFVPILLNARQTLAAESYSDFEKFLNDSYNIETVRKFLNDPQTRTLVIHKQSTSREFIYFFNFI